MLIIPFKEDKTTSGFIFFFYMFIQKKLKLSEFYTQFDLYFLIIRLLKSQFFFQHWRCQKHFYLYLPKHTFMLSQDFHTKVLHTRWKMWKTLWITAIASFVFHRFPRSAFQKMIFFAGRADFLCNILQSNPYPCFFSQMRKMNYLTISIYYLTTYSFQNFQQKKQPVHLCTNCFLLLV